MQVPCVSYPYPFTTSNIRPLSSSWMVSAPSEGRTLHLFLIKIQLLVLLLLERHTSKRVQGVVRVFCHQFDIFLLFFYPS